MNFTVDSKLSHVYGLFCHTAVTMVKVAFLGNLAMLPFTCERITIRVKYNNLIIVDIDLYRGYVAIIFF